MWWANTMEYYSVQKKLYYAIFSKMKGAKRHDAKYSNSGMGRQTVHSISHAADKPVSFMGGWEVRGAEKDRMVLTRTCCMCVKIIH